MAEDGADLVELGLAEGGDALAHGGVVEQPLGDLGGERVVYAAVKDEAPQARGHVAGEAGGDFAIGRAGAQHDLLRGKIGGRAAQLLGGGEQGQRFAPDGVAALVGHDAGHVGVVFDDAPEHARVANHGPCRCS